MATSDRGTELAAEGDPASRIHAAEFVTVSTSPTADAIAATAALVEALEAAALPFHVRVGEAPAIAFVDDVATVAVGGGTDADETVALPAPATPAAAELALTLDAEPDPALAAAGRHAWDPDADSDDAPDIPIERTAGLGLAVSDVADGLPHSTRLRGPWSGANADDGLPTGEHTDGDLASLAAIEALDASAVPERAARAIEAVLAPRQLPDGPVATVPGFADVLEVLAAVDPGAALAFACADDPASEDVLDAWRSGAMAVHDRLAAGPDEDDGDVAVYLAAGPAPHVLARLARAFEVTAPHVIAVTDEAFAVAAGDPGAIDRVAELTHAPIGTRFRHARRLIRGTHAGDPSDVAATVAEVVP